VTRSDVRGVEIGPRLSRAVQILDPRLAMRCFWRGGKWFVWAMGMHHDIIRLRGGFMNISPYLNFPGNTEEAMRFYAQALGGTLTEIHRFGGMPDSEQIPKELHDRVMHV